MQKNFFEPILLESNGFSLPTVVGNHFLQASGHNTFFCLVITVLLVGHPPATPHITQAQMQLCAKNPVKRVTNRLIVKFFSFFR
jgi:hypothetical protein